jgi:DNA-binding CsgD family transcriptional regulator
VSGFLLKVGPPEDLVVAVRTVAAGQGLLDPAVTLRVIESFAAAPSPDPVRAGQLAQLTEREVDVLGLVAAGLTNGEIAARLYLGEATVKTHVSRVLLKLGLRGPRPGGGVRLRERAGDAGPVTWGSPPVVRPTFCGRPRARHDSWRHVTELARARKGAAPLSTPLTSASEEAA